MIAEVGGIVNVSGSKIATPLAPPKPGSTPMMTPRMMPIIINIKLNGVSTTAKPWNSALQLDQMLLRAVRWAHRQ